VITHLKVFDKNYFSEFFKSDRSSVISMVAEEVTAITIPAEQN
jgi:hypothetical protein